jgi:hypothetical protein
MPGACKLSWLKLRKLKRVRSGGLTAMVERIQRYSSLHDPNRIDASPACLRASTRLASLNTKTK